MASAKCDLTLKPLCRFTSALWMTIVVSSPTQVAFIKRNLHRRSCNLNCKVTWARPPRSNQFFDHISINQSINQSKQINQIKPIDQSVPYFRNEPMTQRWTVKHIPHPSKNSLVFDNFLSYPAKSLAEIQTYKRRIRHNVICGGNKRNLLIHYFVRDSHYAGLRVCTPDPFPDWMSYKATKL